MKFKFTPPPLLPFPWAPPFYLAPPFYPHSKYHQKNPGPHSPDAYNPPTPTSSTPDPAFGVEPQPENQDYYPHQIPVRELFKLFGIHSPLSSTDEMEDSSQACSDLPGLSDQHSATGFPLEHQELDRVFRSRRSVLEEMSLTKCHNLDTVFPPDIEQR